MTRKLYREVNNVLLGALPGLAPAPAAVVRGANDVSMPRTAQAASGGQKAQAPGS